MSKTFVSSKRGLQFKLVVTFVTSKSISFMKFQSRSTLVQVSLTLFFRTSQESLLPAEWVVSLHALPSCDSLVRLLLWDIELQTSEQISQSISILSWAAHKLLEEEALSFQEPLEEIIFPCIYPMCVFISISVLNFFQHMLQ